MRLFKRCAGELLKHCRNSSSLRALLLVLQCEWHAQLSAGISDVGKRSLGTGKLLIEKIVHELVRVFPHAVVWMVVWTYCEI
jgi:hypothetical protein